jgi:hypothetical protein
MARPDDAHNPRRVTGPNLIRPHLRADQLGKPYSSRREAVSRPQGREMMERVEDAGESECRPVMGQTGPQKRGYPTRKGADFRLVSTKVMHGRSIN